MALSSSGNQGTTKPTPFVPQTVCDSLDVGQTGQGGMMMLQNLVPDPTTKNAWVPRPASILLTNFSGFTSPGFISALEVYGNYAVGMIASGRNAGHDEPFVYNLLTNTFQTVSGVTSSNVPTSPPSSGSWVPPILCNINQKVLIAHPGYNGAGNGYFGVINMATPSAPVYSSGTVTGQPTSIPSPPVSIAGFANRAWFACNPSGAMPVLTFSDPNNPTSVTNAGAVQQLTLGDWVSITALGSLQYENQLGGIVQALIVFKGVGNIYQVTGDAATSNLALNTLNVATGTLSPLSITNTPKGLVFLSPDGFRIIDQNGTVSEPLGADGSGIVMPFIYSTNPSRIIATSNAKIVRCSTYNGDPNGAGVRQMYFPSAGQPQEWWYDTSRGCWCGPHTLPCDQCAAWNDSFIIAPIGIPAALYQSDYKQRTTSTFLEPYPTGPGAATTPVQMSWIMQFPLTPEDGSMNNYQLTESYLTAQYDNLAHQITGAMVNEFGANLASTMMVPPNASASKWGSMTWGVSTWGGGPNGYSMYRTAFERQPVFGRASIFFQCQSGMNGRMGTWWARINTLGAMKDAALIDSQVGQVV